MDRVEAHLHELLRQARKFPPEYRGGLTNHLPMALIALVRIGAGEAELDRFFETYSQRLAQDPPASQHSLRTPAEVIACFGIRERFGDIQGFFERELESVDPSTLVARWIPALLPGVAAAAFHGPIRLAYGAIAEDRGEIAAGLAYWSARYLALPQPALVRGNLDVTTWRVQLAARFADWSPSGDLISDALAAVAIESDFAELAAQIQCGDRTLTHLARDAAVAFVESGNFTVLHVLTSAHALMRLHRFCGHPEWDLTPYFTAVAAAFAASSRATSRTELAPIAPGLIANWPELCRQARASGDDHSIKLAYSCIELEEELRGVEFRTAAWRRCADPA